MNTIKEILINSNANLNKEDITKYLDFIDSCITPNLDEYGEKHHILPKSIFPEYKSERKFPWNIKRLYAKDHFIAHYLLYKIYPNNYKILHGWKILFSNRFGELRQDFLSYYADQYEEIRIKHSEFMRNKEITEETRKKMSESGRKKIFTKEHKENMKIAHTGKHHSKETREKIGKNQRGVSRGPMSQEQKDKISKTLKSPNRPPRSKESIERTASKHRGQKRSEESKERMRQSAAKRWTPEARERVRQQISKRKRTKKGHLCPGSSGD